MNDIPFSDPLILQFQTTGQRRVASCLAAMQCLENEWPNWARGRSWRRAKFACGDALEGRLDAKKARQRLLKAARRAGILATSGRNDLRNHGQQDMGAAVAL
jgi:hypothetical protein